MLWHEAQLCETGCCISLVSTTYLISTMEWFLASDLKKRQSSKVFQRSDCWVCMLICSVLVPQLHAFQSTNCFCSLLLLFWSLFCEFMFYFRPFRSMFSFVMHFLCMHSEVTGSLVCVFSLCLFMCMPVSRISGQDIWQYFSQVFTRTCAQASMYDIRTYHGPSTLPVSPKT